MLFCCLAFLPALPAMRAQDGSWRLGREAACLHPGQRPDRDPADATPRPPTPSCSCWSAAASRDDPPGGSGLAYLTVRLGLEITDQAKLQAADGLRFLLLAAQ